MTASIVQDRRSDRAVGIVERQELMLQDDGSWKVRDTHGSGKWYTVIDGNCSCPDATYRAVTCKHTRAVLAEERALAEYCDGWNSRSEQARAALTPEDLDWLTDDVNRDEYSGPYGSDGWPQPRPCCPECGAELECRSYYVGGRGMMAFLCCTLHNGTRRCPRKQVRA